MDKERIENILNDEAQLERFVEVLVDEINNDDEAYDKKGCAGGTGNERHRKSCVVILNLPTYPVTQLWQEGFEFDEANIFEGAFYPCIIAAPYQGALKVQFKEIIVLLLYIL